MDPLALLLPIFCLALAPRAAGELVSAVLLLHDDDFHTFRQVSAALERLGLSPPQALLVTSDVNAMGIGLACKGAVKDLEAGTRSPLGVIFSLVIFSLFHQCIINTVRQYLKVSTLSHPSTSSSCAPSDVGVGSGWAPEWEWCDCS